MDKKKTPAVPKTNKSSSGTQGFMTIFLKSEPANGRELRLKKTESGSPRASQGGQFGR